MFGNTLSVSEALTVCVFSIVTVFAVLIAIEIMISVMAKLVAPKKEKPVSSAVVPEVKEEVQTIENDDSLIAVITAAIVAGRGKRAPGFVIKSISPAENEWGKISRSSSLR